jgi:hypothetical protein
MHDLASVLADLHVWLFGALKAGKLPNPFEVPEIFYALLPAWTHNLE